MNDVVRQLPNKIYAPPGGWRYRVPETGQTFRGASEYQLLTQVQANYRANSLTSPDVDTLKKRFEQFVCEQEPDYCTDIHGQPFPPKGGRFFDFTNVIQGTRTIGGWLLAGMPTVSQAQADKRAATCVGCPQNDEPQGCSTCNVKELTNITEALVGKRRTAVHDHLKSCRVCTCLLRVKVWFPLSRLLPYMPEEQVARLPAHCWLLTEKSATPPTT
jgi:hypothetical protein